MAQGTAGISGAEGDANSILHLANAVYSLAQRVHAYSEFMVDHTIGGQTAVEVPPDPTGIYDLLRGAAGTLAMIHEDLAALTRHVVPGGCESERNPVPRRGEPVPVDRPLR